MFHGRLLDARRPRLTGPGACAPPETSARSTSAIRDRSGRAGAGSCPGRPAPGRHRRAESSKDWTRCRPGRCPRPSAARTSSSRRSPGRTCTRLLERPGRAICQARADGRSPDGPGLAKLCLGSIDRILSRTDAASVLSGRRGWPPLAEREEGSADRLQGVSGRDLGQARELTGCAMCCVEDAASADPDAIPQRQVSKPRST